MLIKINMAITMCIKRYIVVGMDGVTETKLVVNFEGAYEVSFG